jgi:2-oxoglutarate dehydrogenase E2 component (dihydrolipoamide succinyltransferase)
MSIKIILPEMGEGIIEGRLARWLVREGDQIEAFDPLAEIETDKVTTEITSENAGTILRLHVAEGQTVPVGTVLTEIAAEDEEPAAEPPTNGHNGRHAPNLQPQEESYTGRISPLVGRIAAENDVDLNQVQGTGLHGRITKQDILAYLAQESDAAVASQTTTIPAPPAESPPAAPPTKPQPSAPVSQNGDELLPHSGIRRAIAEHMVRSKQVSPHVTTVFEFDFTAVSAHRQAHKAAFAADGARLTYMAYIVAATVGALKEHQRVNSSWSDAGILLHRAINVGMAVAIDDGLIVPVIRGADGMNLLGLARAINELADRARAGELRPDEVQGGTFSITNHGTSGSLFATPVINQPQAGILGIGKIEKRVKVINDAIAIRPLAYASFTFDHRILDGASADAFVNAVKERIEKWV